MKNIFILLFLFCVVGCSSTAIPMIISRRLNDRGETYNISFEKAKELSIKVIEEMNGEISWIQPGPDKQNNVHYTVSNEKIIHGTFGVLQEGIFQNETNFIVFLNALPQHRYNLLRHGNKENNVKIRIGMGAWGNSELSEEFHLRLNKHIENSNE